MTRTTFHVEKMDCAAEEHLVRMRLEGEPGVERLSFDLATRLVTVVHSGDVAPVRAAFDGLGLGSREVAPAADVDDEEPHPGDERRALWTVFAINGALFVGEAAAGLFVGSMGLVADSLDMLADALVYALSLSVVGAVASRKVRVARLSGYLQFALAAFGLVEVVRRFVSPAEAPEPVTMVVVSLVALVGNVAALRVLTRERSREAHMEASRIFTSNDVKVNLLVVAAGAAVYLTASSVPDLLAGGFIFLIVANGARRILALSR